MTALTIAAMTALCYPVPASSLSVVPAQAGTHNHQLLKDLLNSPFETL